MSTEYIAVMLSYELCFYMGLKVMDVVDYPHGTTSVRSQLLKFVPPRMLAKFRKIQEHRLLRPVSHCSSSQCKINVRIHRVLG